VKENLLKGGIDTSRIRTKGYGKSKPKADNATEEGRQINRRVEIEIL
jgi:outer membrane protein OmpA-like peptidoglycan-associated protein